MRIVVGGYDPSLAPEALRSLRRRRLHRPRRRRADAARAAARARDRPAIALATIAGLVVPHAGRIRPQRRPCRHRARLGRAPRCRTARARVLGGYTLLGRPVDVVETSRGCTFDCSFCSIIEMRGRNFHPYPLDRVARRHRRRAAPRRAGDLPRRRQHHARTSPRFEALCEAIIDAGFNDIDYIVQAMTAPHRAARRDAGAADEARRVPLRLPRHRERARRRSGRS